MQFKSTYFLAAAVMVVSSCTWLLAQSAPTTTLSEVTKLIVATPFDQTTPWTRKGAIQGWQAGIGQWRIDHGALHGDEVPEDHHASSGTYRIEASELVITAQFRLGTAEHVAFGCRDAIAPNHHLGRTFISRDAIWIQKMSGIAKTTKAEKLVEKQTKFDPEAWYDITIEIIGDRYSARVGQHTIHAQDERFTDAKGLVALIVKGQGAQFKNVALWHAKPLQKNP